MAEYITTITKKGLDYLAKLIAGDTVEYTKMVIGDGTLQGEDTLLLEDVISPKITIVELLTKAHGDGTATVTGQYDNSNIVTGFFAREIGVYVRNPDVGEILFSYINLEYKAGWIFPQDTPFPVEKRINVITIIGNATEVKATINSGIYVTHEDLAGELNLYVTLETHQKDLSNKLDGKTYYGDLTLFVSPSGNDETGDGTEEKPYKTLDFVFGKLEKTQVSGGEVSVMLLDGQYVISAAYWNLPFINTLNLLGVSEDRSKVEILLVDEVNKWVNVSLFGFFISKNVTFKRDSIQKTYFFNFTQGAFRPTLCDFSGGGMICHESYLSVINCNISNCYRAITCGAGGFANAYRNTGANNDFAFAAIGGIIIETANTINATTKYYFSDKGVVNPPSQV